MKIQRKGVSFMKKTMALILVLMFALGCLSSCENTPNEVSQDVSTESSVSDFESSAADDEKSDDILVPMESCEDRTDSLEKVFCTATLEDEFRDNQIVIVVFPEYNKTPYTIEDFVDVGCIELIELSYTVPDGVLGRMFELTLNEHCKQNVLDCIKILEARADIYSAEPNVIFVFDSVPNDPIFTDGNELTNWGIEKIDLPSAWNISVGSNAVLVGVIDSGIDADHPDLINRVNRNLSRCFTSDYDTGCEDEEGHGTHVAGIIGAQANNSIGISGVCWNVQLVSLRIALDDGTADLSKIANAINYAEQVNIPILNCSVGVQWYDSLLYSCETALQNYSGLFVCSAGNDGDNNDTEPCYPSCFDSDNIIAVGASTIEDSKHGYSNWGKTTVDIFAPGKTILSCYPISMCAGGTHDTISSTHYSNGYHYMDGTSMASPYVAGVAALMLSVNPDLTPLEIKQKIINSADTNLYIQSYGIDYFKDACVSDGRLNAYSALSIASTHTHVYTSSYSMVSSARHMAYCSCGAGVSQAHQVEQVGNVLRCVKCGYENELWR